MDTWKLSGEGLRPTSGWQAAGGLYWTVWNSQVDLSAEVYWKQMRDYLARCSAVPVLHLSS